MYNWLISNAMLALFYCFVLFAPATPLGNGAYEPRDQVGDSLGYLLYSVAVMLGAKRIIGKARRWLSIDKTRYQVDAVGYSVIVAPS